MSCLRFLTSNFLTQISYADESALANPKPTVTSQNQTTSVPVKPQSMQNAAQNPPQSIQSQSSFWSSPKPTSKQSRSPQNPPPSQDPAASIPPPSPVSGTVFSDSTSLFQIGSQNHTLTSATRRIPIRMLRLPKEVYDSGEPVKFTVTNPDNEAFSTTIHDPSGKTVNYSCYEKL